MDNCLQFPDVVCAPPPTDALKELLKGRAAYSGAGLPAAIAPFNYAQVSVPDSVLEGPSLSSLLPVAASTMLEDYRAHMLRPSAEVAEFSSLFGEAGRHVDPVFLQRPLAYARFVREMARIGVISFTRRCSCEIGLFFVWKKNGTMRLIQDCRAVNRLFRSPPGVSLLSGEGLGKIEIGSEAPEDLLSEFDLTTADVSDYFHRLRLEGPIRNYFCWPPLTAQLAGVQEVDGVSVERRTQVWPMSCSLPMGWSWSLFLAQQASSLRLSSLSCSSETFELYDQGPPLVLGGPGGDARYVYVDNIGRIGLDKGKGKEFAAEAVESFGAVNLKLHEVELNQQIGETLGVTVDGSRGETRNTERRTLRLWSALGALLSRRRVCGWELEAVMGHVTHYALVRREALSLFHCTYRFCQRHYWEAAVLWDSVRSEVASFRGLMPLIVAQWRGAWCGEVFAGDASLSGFGISSSQWSSEDVAAVGRVPERRRWRLGAGLARAHAFEKAGLEQGDDGKYRVREQELDDEELECFVRAARWEADTDFPEVPAELIGRHAWRGLAAARWQYTDDILRLEARVLEKITSLLGRLGLGEGSRVLVLGDNLACILCFSRCRAKDFRLLVQVRRACATILAMGFRVCFRWVPSEFNASDEGSRIFDTNSSKNLLDVLKELGSRDHVARCPDTPCSSAVPCQSAGAGSPALPDNEETSRPSEDTPAADVGPRGLRQGPDVGTPRAWRRPTEACPVGGRSGGPTARREERTRRGRRGGREHRERGGGGSRRHAVGSSSRTPQKTSGSAPPSQPRVPTAFTSGGGVGRAPHVGDLQGGGEGVFGVVPGSAAAYRFARGGGLGCRGVDESHVRERTQSLAGGTPHRGDPVPCCGVREIW